MHIQAGLGIINIITTFYIMQSPTTTTPPQQSTFSKTVQLKLKYKTKIMLGFHFSHSTLSYISISVRSVFRLHCVAENYTTKQNFNGFSPFIESLCKVCAITLKTTTLCCWPNIDYFIPVVLMTTSAA